MLYDRFGNPLRSSLFPEQTVVTQASTEANARAYLENVENQMKVEAQNQDQEILAREAQRREQERLNRIAQSQRSEQALSAKTGYNKYGYPEVLPVKIREMVAYQASDADAFAQRQTERANSLLNASLDSTEQLAGESEAAAGKYSQSQHPQNQTKANEWDFLDDWQDTPEAFAESTSKTPSNNYGQRKMQMPQMTRQQMMMAGAVPLAGAALYGANALASGGNERWERTATNTLGNLAGAAAGAYGGGIAGGVIAGSKIGGFPGMLVGGAIGGIAGALGGGYASDRIADAFDPTMGMNNEALALQAEEKKQAALTLLNQYLDPRAQAALEKRLMQNQMEIAQ